MGEHTRSADERFLVGGGEMGALIRSHDWAATSIGRLATWPQSLRTALRILLNTGHPMYVFWGPDLLCFYNDAYRASIGPERHPVSLGKPAREVWAEIWDIIGPQIDQVMAGGGATWHENQLVPITRNGRREEVYWTYSYGPIDDDAAANGVGGVLVVCTETTSTVLAERHRAEEAARQRRLFEQAPGFIIIMRGPEHVVDFVNDAHRRLFGSGDWVGKNIRQAFPDLVGQGFFELLDGVFASGETYRAFGAPVRFHTASSLTVETRFLDFIYAPLLGDDGAVTGVFCEGFDVTERRVAERALERSEEQRRLATEAAEVGLWDVDVVADTLFWPPRVKAMFGISPEAPVSMADFYAGLHPDDRDHVAAAYAAAADPARRLVYDAEYRTIGKEDGIVRWVGAKGRGVFDDDGRCLRVIGTAIDITARKETEHALHRLNETLEQRVAERTAERNLLAKLFEATDVFIMVVDLDWRILAINKANEDEFERIHGIRPKVGDHLLDLLADQPEHQAQVKAGWGRALAGEDYTFVEAFGDSALDRPYYEIKFNTLRNERGERVGAYNFVYNVTERLRDQARLAQAEEESRQSQKMEAVGQLTGGVAHDFNNLLTVIRSSVDLLKRPDLSEDRRQRYISAISDTTSRAAKLTGQLLAFARRQALRPEVFDVAASVRAIGDMFATLAGSRIAIDMRVPDLPCLVNADASQFETALVNMAVNARDAMKGEGTLSVVVGTASGIPTVRAHPPVDGIFVTVALSDTGEGIAPGDLERIFEPFFTTKAVGQGTGLGLSQVFGFAKQSGGEVDVASEPGRGTTFTLYLPEARGAVPPAELEWRNRPVDGHGTRVLVVEDNADVGSFTTQSLAELGYETVLAAGADAALEKLASDSAWFDAVFSDVVMPGMTGIELGQEIRRRHPDLPVVLTSGYSAVLAENGTFGFELLHKPYSIEQLSRVLQKAAHWRRLNRILDA